ncbi:uncharacterized protein LAJ45_04136 [Morchella importuna]|uniref:uncharacterized protein n=1 Tax=Morchella importuna TaxID=1174673 RepID=UPI001E8E9E25|nr:uncharacterized protein LAJ45_04136 [Morchella importuna]KAH8151515.1 hypothetical protein LAJ45_04136 [Morchella importuna]
MKLILVSSLLALAAATPIEHAKRGGGAFDSTYQVGSITSSQVVAAAPGSSSCATASFADECHDAGKATPLLNDAFKQYKQTTLGEVAALLGLMALESGDFQFNVNHYPGRPGQGTKAMLMFNFIHDYAVDAGMKAQVAEIAGSDQVDSMSDDKKNKIRALVTTDKYTFAAAPWFLSKKCTPEVQKGVKEGGFKGFQTYMQDCVGTGALSASDDRGKKWCAAVKAVKPDSMSMPSECA